MFATRNAVQYCLTTCRNKDALFLPTIFAAPTHARNLICAVRAFNAEIIAVPQQVSDPKLGMMRMVWWRDTIDAIAKAHARVQPNNPSSSSSAPRAAGKSSSSNTAETADVPESVPDQPVAQALLQLSFNVPFRWDLFHSIIDARV